MHVYQLLGHLLYLGDEVCEELCHVLLLSSVERLFVHSVGFTERSWVVGFSLTLLNRQTNGGEGGRKGKFRLVTLVWLIQSHIFGCFLVLLSL